MGSPVLQQYGWDERVSARYHDLVRDDARRFVPGRVVRVERTACQVATDGGLRSAAAPQLPAVGDWVALEVRDDAALVRGVVARWSTLARRDPERDEAQVLAANVDLVLVTVPGDRPSLPRAERECVLAWESGGRPVVVLTKADLAPAGLPGELEDRLVGVDVLVTSCVSGVGVDEMAALVAPNLTAVLIGPSGAGKSSLVNALLGSERMATAAVRDADARGRHTTTSRQLVPVPSGGVLVDTPGLRSLGLLGDEGVAAAFTEIDDLAAACRFRDCAHDGEPDCAVVAAVADGRLAPERLESFRKLQREVAFERRRVDPVERRAAEQRWKAINKAHRRAPSKDDPQGAGGRGRR